MENGENEENFEGPRFFRLTGAINKTLDRIETQMTWEKFISCFPPEFAQDNKELLFESHSNSMHSIFRENVTVRKILLKKRTNLNYFLMNFN
jgi:hypothetical protein